MSHILRGEAIPPRWRRKVEKRADLVPSATVEQIDAAIAALKRAESTIRVRHEA